MPKTLTKSISLKSAKSYPQIFTFLQKFERIRIIVNDGRGFGHQAANITLIQRLREIGFTGVIEVCYCEDNTGVMGKRLAVLLPEFNPTIAGRQVLPGQIEVLKIANLKLTEIHRLHFAPITITAADDAVSLNIYAPIIYNSGIHLSLSPTDWANNPDCPISNRIKILGCDGTVLLPDSAVLHCDTYSPVKIESIADESTRKFIAQLQQGHKSDRLVFQSIYGLYDSNDPNVELFALISSLCAVQIILSKPIIILVHSEIDENYYNKLLTSLNDYLEGDVSRIKIFNSMQDTSLFLEEYTLERNTMIICKTGVLSKSLFETLLMESVLPPVVEGCNSIAFLEPRRSFLHGGSTHLVSRVPDEYLDQYQVSPDIQTLFFAACQVLESKVVLDNKPLIEFFMRVIQYDEQIIRYFMARSAYFNDRIDIVATALFASNEISFPTTAQEACAALFSELTRIIQQPFNSASHIYVISKRLFSLINDENVAPQQFVIFNECLIECIKKCCETVKKMNKKGLDFEKYMFAAASLAILITDDNLKIEMMKSITETRLKILNNKFNIYNYFKNPEAKDEKNSIFRDIMIMNNISILSMLYQTEAIPSGAADLNKSTQSFSSRRY